jgi:transposase
LLRGKKIRAVIPTRKDQKQNPRFDKSLYRQRNQIERLIGRYKNFRRLATRYDKRAANYRAWWLIAACRLWIPFANSS